MKCLLKHTRILNGAQPLDSPDMSSLKRRDGREAMFGSRLRMAAHDRGVRISLIKVTPAALIGYVDAPDAETPIKKAVEEFKITDRRGSDG
jgi:hypothetical protein